MMHSFDYLYGRVRTWCPIPVLAALLAVGAPRPAAGQIHIAAGSAWGRGGSGIAAEVGMRRPLGRDGRLAVGAATTVGDAGSHFGTAEARLEVRLDPTAVFAPFLEVGAGVLAEHEALRGGFSLGLGLAPRIGAGRRLRLVGAWSRTDGSGGPYRVLIGMEFAER